MGVFRKPTDFKYHYESLKKSGKSTTNLAPNPMTDEAYTNMLNKIHEDWSATSRKIRAEHDAAVKKGKK